MSIRALSQPIVIEALERRTLFSGPYLIAATGASGAIFDATRNRIYVPTSGGAVLRYDLNTKATLAPRNAVGGSLGGGDITPDGKAIYVADRTIAAGQGLVEKVSLDTGAVKPLPFALDYDDAASSVVITSDGKAWVSHSGQWGNIRSITISTDTYGTPGPSVYGDFIVRGKDRSLVYWGDLGVSPPSSGYYDVTTHTWGGGAWNSGNGEAIAISPGGSEVAVGNAYLDRKLTLLRTESPAVTPIGYDPNGSVLYTLDSTNHKVIAIDQHTYVTKFSFSVDADINTFTAGRNTSAATDDGHWLLLTGTSGVHVYDLTPYKSTTNGSIAGNIFKDVNGNGSKDATTDAALTNVRVYIDTNKNGAFDSASEKSVLTDASGNFKFTGLSSGITYRIRQVLSSGYKIASPSAGYYDIALAANAAVTGKNFADAPVGSISGRVFNDANADGTRQTGELGLGLWQVYLDINKDGKLDTGDVSATTDADGGWSFTNLIAGTYVVRIVQRAKTSTTTPAAGSYSVSLAAGQNATNKLFGERGIA